MFVLAASRPRALLRQEINKPPPSTRASVASPRSDSQITDRSAVRVYSGELSLIVYPSLVSNSPFPPDGPPGFPHQMLSTRRLNRTTSRPYIRPAKDAISPIAAQRPAAEIDQRICCGPVGGISKATATPLENRERSLSRTLTLRLVSGARSLSRQIVTSATADRAVVDVQDHRVRVAVIITTRMIVRDFYPVVIATCERAINHL